MNGVIFHLVCFGFLGKQPLCHGGIIYWVLHNGIYYGCFSAFGLKYRFLTHSLLLL
jgi:hypothetical protein